MSFNKVLLIGNVGKDPEVRHLEGGSVVANFTLATSERFKDKNGTMQDITEWHNIVCWRNLAELSEKYIKKGSQVFIEGKIRTRSWTDQTGSKRYSTEILADNIRLLDRKGSQNQEGQASVEAAIASQIPGVNLESQNADDDLPF
ncbi:MAG: single-stranded DNA-binding protein [Bacteroidia bacterium]|nr:single-stranded DNA-binding protein [Bacteroidia bacterium]